MERFWKKVKKTAKCWEWTAGKTCGYGTIQMGTLKNPKMIRAHRLSYEMAHGKIPSGMQVCHKCDNRACVRPAHLFIGTNDDNIRDMHKKMRHSFGTKRPLAKVNDKKVLDIRHLCSIGITQTQIAKKFGISQGTVSDIHTRKMWKHI